MRPGSVKLYTGVVYSSTYDLYTNRDDTLVDWREKPNTSLPNPDKVKKVEIKPTFFRQPQSQESRQVPNQELTTHKKNKIPRTKQLL